MISFSVFKDLSYFICVSVFLFSFHVCMCTVCVWCPGRLEEVLGTSGTGIPDYYKPPCGCAEYLTGVLCRSSRCS